MKREGNGVERGRRWDHFLQGVQRRVRTNGGGETGGSRVADLVDRKAGREPAEHPTKIHAHELGKVRWLVREVKGREELEKEKGMVWNDVDGGITYTNSVNVVFTRMAVVRLVASTSPIWLF